MAKFVAQGILHIIQRSDLADEQRIEVLAACINETITYAREEVLFTIHDELISAFEKRFGVSPR